MTGPGGAPPAGEVEVPEPTAVDAGRPNIARVYDYLLGGKDNYAADRAETARLIEVFPLLPVRARQNRLFLARAVTWLAGQGSPAVRRHRLRAAHREQHPPARPGRLPGLPGRLRRPGPGGGLARPRAAVRHGRDRLARGPGRPGCDPGRSRPAAPDHAGRTGGGDLGDGAVLHRLLRRRALGSSPNSATAWHPAATWSSRSAARTAPTRRSLPRPPPTYAGARMLLRSGRAFRSWSPRESDPGVGSRRQGRRFYRRTLLARAQELLPVELPEQPKANWQRISHVSHDHRVRAAREPSGAVQCTEARTHLGPFVSRQMTYGPARPRGPAGHPVKRD